VKRPLILFALPQELRPFLAICRRSGALTLERTRGAYLLHAPASDFDVGVCGPGAANVEAYLRERSPSEILHCGVAGGVSSRVARGAVYRLARVRRAHDVFDLAPSRWTLGPFAALPEASIVTVPLPCSAKDKLLMREHAAGDLVDMETAVVAALCAARAIPYTGLRAVSDLAEEEIPEIVRASFDGRRFKTSTIIGGVLHDLGTLPRLLALARATRSAATALATVVAGAIGARGPDS
jgi:hypothetical protein